MKKLKHQIASVLGLVGVTAGLVASCFTFKFPEKNNSKENRVYIQELNEINNEKIVFQNQELYNFLCNKLNTTQLTKSSLNNIYSLVIENTFNNNDFSDLKYLPNLTKLYINNNDIDLNDLYYNSNLDEISINYGNISNTSQLPNSIRKISFRNINITDGLLVIPYNTYMINTYYTKFNSFTLKNPGSIKRLTIEGDAFLDLNSLKNATNLNYFNLTKCANVSNAEILKSLNIKELLLDDYSTIWLKKDIINNIEYKSLLGNIKDEVDTLDNIIEELDLNNLSDKQKTDKIIEFVIDKLQYDKYVDNNTKGAENQVQFYNNLPIYYAVRFSDSISVNYSCLLQALCNRAGLINYQVLEDEKRTWNNIDGTIVDSLNYDLTNNKMYLDLNSSEYKSLLEPLSSPYIVDNIGYIKPSDRVEITFNGKKLKLKIGAYFLAIFLITLGYSIATCNIKEDYELDEEEYDTKPEIKNNKKENKTNKKKSKINLNINTSIFNKKYTIHKEQPKQKIKIKKQSFEDIINNLNLKTKKPLSKENLKRAEDYNLRFQNRI